MIITLQIEIGKEKIENFEDLTVAARKIALQIGREIVKQTLKAWDDNICEHRNKKRYRCKGKRKTCIKTWFGDIEYERNVYVDNQSGECGKCVYLLDEEKKISKIGCVDAEMCKMAAQSVIKSSYRGAAKEISDMTGLSISAQGVWNIVQKIGKNRREQIKQYAKQARQNKGVGKVESKILYEENDGIWLSLQGKSREKYGAASEMKVGIAYDGATWQIGKGKKKRRTLDNKVAYAAFEGAADFRKHKEGIVASHFNVDEIEQRIINGDGAQWIQKSSDVPCICVLDKFHRNKKITECVKDNEFAKLLRKLLYEGNIDDLMLCLEAGINSAEDLSEQKKMKELYTYYDNNREALSDPYSRGVKIPETREPGVVHHARLGSMESNVFTLIGNRMKGRRASWSIDGANHLAAILCAEHTTGMHYIFGTEQEVPIVWENKPDTLPMSAAKVPKRVGRGYEPQHSAILPSLPWLKQLVAFKPLGEI